MTKPELQLGTEVLSDGLKEYRIRITGFKQRLDQAQDRCEQLKECPGLKGDFLIAKNDLAPEMGSYVIFYRVRR